MSSGRTSQVSVLILTKNEERDLPDCLSSVSWSDDIHVLDSESTDATRNIARSYGANVTVRKFDGYATQRNYGLGLPFRHEWILVLDADERVPDALRTTIMTFVRDATREVCAARFRRRDYWWGKWLKYSQISPLYIRLMRVGRASYEREINEVLHVDGEVVDIDDFFIHYPFSKGLTHWIAKHNSYSSMEAELIAQRRVPMGSWTRALFDRDFNIRRYNQKALFYRVPFRPIVKLLYILLVRRGVLDGMAGVRYAILQAVYEYFIVLKVAESAKLSPAQPDRRES